MAPVKADEIVLNEFYTFGNEPRKYTSSELREISRAMLSGKGALFELEMFSKIDKKK